MAKITAHTLVKNEERFLWFSVMSVIDCVDEVLLWDMGSEDGTREVIKVIGESSEKIKTRFLDGVGVEEFADVRQEMLSATKTDWFLVVDGDEIWWQDSIRRVVRTIREEGEGLESIVVPTVNLVGDMYHYQEERAGLYRLAGRRGHLSLRAVNRKIPGLHSRNPHGTWGWADEDGKQIQDRDQKKIKFLDAPYLHATFLERSSLDRSVPKRAKKRRHELGIAFPGDYFYPEVFFRPRPDFVEVPWTPMNMGFKFRAFFETPLRKAKRRLLPSKVGY